MERKFLKIDGRDIHYRICGSGPMLFLLHPSPLSSSIFIPFMQLLLNNFTVIALDTPGYGNSDKLLKANTIDDYVSFFNDFFELMTDDKFYLYGSATGAQFAVAYARKYPQKINHLYLDNAAHLSQEQRQEILENYFIDISPKENGSHLVDLADHVKLGLQYFPWYKNTAENKFTEFEPSPELVQLIMNAYLQAGPQYATAYKLAFEHEDVANVQLLKTPTTIFKWLGSPILKYIQQLLSFEMPKNIKVEEIPANAKERLEQMALYLINNK